MYEEVLRADVKLNAQGRVVVPAAFRRALGFKPGDELIMYVEDGGLRIDTADNILRRLQDEFARSAGDKDVVELLLQQRREEAQRFDEEHPWADDLPDATRSDQKRSA